MVYTCMQLTILSLATSTIVHIIVMTYIAMHSHDDGSNKLDIVPGLV